MDIRYIHITRAFREAIPPDMIPDEALTELHRLKSSLIGKGFGSQEFFDSMSARGVLTTQRMLVTFWEEEWDKTHPTQTQLMERYRQIFMDMDPYPPDNGIEVKPMTDNKVQHIRDLINAEEPDLEAQYFEFLTQKEIDIANRMVQLLKSSELDIPPIITQFIEENSNNSRGIEQE